MAQPSLIIVRGIPVYALVSMVLNHSGIGRDATREGLGCIGVVETGTPD
jgi:hypothetical protein